LFQNGLDTNLKIELRNVAGTLIKFIIVLIISMLMTTSISGCKSEVVDLVEESGTQQHTEVEETSEETEGVEGKAEESYDEELVLSEDNFDLWWEKYKMPVNLDSSLYPFFMRGAFGSRIDELRKYLINAERLREAGFDTIMVETEVVFDPGTEKPRALAQDIFIFYMQALKRQGFRIILVPDAMHPNLDMGKGYQWEENDEDAYYQRSYELIKSFDDVVLALADIAEEYRAEGFVTGIEPHCLVTDFKDADRWLGEILPEIKNHYSGKIIASDSMYNSGDIRDIPFPYDYTDYDMILCGPPAGRKDVESWRITMENYIDKALSYIDIYNMEGFGLYEWGGYTGGVWYEDTQMGAIDQCLSQEEAGEIVSAGIDLLNEKAISNFPRISKGWVDFDTYSFNFTRDWYLDMGGIIKPLENKTWTYYELIDIEKKLGGSDYEYIAYYEN